MYCTYEHVSIILCQAQHTDLRRGGGARLTLATNTSNICLINMKCKHKMFVILRGARLAVLSRVQSSC